MTSNDIQSAFAYIYIPNIRHIALAADSISGDQQKVCNIYARSETVWCRTRQRIVYRITRHDLLSVNRGKHKSATYKKAYGGSPIIDTPKLWLDSSIVPIIFRSNMLNNANLYRNTYISSTKFHYRCYLIQPYTVFDNQTITFLSRRACDGCVLNLLYPKNLHQLNLTRIGPSPINRYVCGVPLEDV